MRMSNAPPPILSRHQAGMSATISAKEKALGLVLRNLLKTCNRGLRWRATAARMHTHAPHSTDPCRQCTQPHLFRIQELTPNVSTSVTDTHRQKGRMQLSVRALASTCAGKSRTSAEYRNRIQSSEFRIQNSEFRIQNSEFRIQNSEFRIQNTEYRIQATDYTEINRTHHVWPTIGARLAQQTFLGVAPVLLVE
jgi:hypothetical protein